VLFYLLMEWPQLTVRAQEHGAASLAPGFYGFMRECDRFLGQYCAANCS